MRRSVVPILIKEFVFTETAAARRVKESFRHGHGGRQGSTVVARFHDVGHQLSGRDARGRAQDRFLDRHGRAGCGGGGAIAVAAECESLAVEKFLKVADKADGSHPGYFDDAGGEKRIPAGPRWKIRRVVEIHRPRGVVVTDRGPTRRRRRGRRGGLVEGPDVEEPCVGPVADDFLARTACVFDEQVPDDPRVVLP